MVCLLHVLSFVLALQIGTNSAVIELTDQDFESRLRGAKALVMFYSPSCGHCQRVKPTYEQLSTHNSIQQSNVIIAKVDCTDKGKETCGKYGVRGFPTIKFISRADGPETTEDYEGNRQLNDFISFVDENSRPLVQELTDVDIESFVKSTTKPVAVGFFKDSKSKLFIKFLSLVASNRKNFIFGYTYSQEAAKKLSHKVETVVIYRQQQYRSPVEPDFIVETTESKLQNLLQDNKHSLVEIRDPKNEQDFIHPLIVAFFPLDPTLQKSVFRRLRNILIRLAKIETDVKFAISISSVYKPFITEFAPESKENEIHLVAYDKDDRKLPCKESVVIEDHKAFGDVLQRFVEDFKKSDVLESFVKSEAMPIEDDGDVKVVVGKNFKDIVMDDSKDVLIEFYAPWCGHCKQLTPIYRQLAALLKDEKNVVIAKMDATANEVPKGFKVEGFPTIYLAKAGDKLNPVAFSGNRNVAGMLAWLKQHTKHTIKYDGAVDEPKDEL